MGEGPTRSAYALSWAYRDIIPRVGGSAMDALAGVLVFLAAIFLGSILALLLVLLWSIRTRKRARLEMKRHLQKLELPGSA